MDGFIPGILMGLACGGVLCIAVGTSVEDVMQRAAIQQGVGEWKVDAYGDKTFHHTPNPTNTPE